MSAITTSTGLISGLDFEALTKALTARQTAVVSRYKARIDEATAKKTGVQALEANVLSFSAAVSALSIKGNFQNIKVNNPASTSLQVVAEPNAVAGSYRFQAIQTATAQQTISRGYADATRTVGSGQIVISSGGELAKNSLLESLNDGAGIRRGQIQITDRSGKSATIDLTSAVSVDDVLSAINNNTNISVRATTDDGKLVLKDLTGSSSTDLLVTDINGGHTAEDLGIRKSSSSSTLSGNNVFYLTENSSLNLINDGNPLQLNALTDDLEFTLQDGSKFKVDFGDSKSLGEIVRKINNDSDNSNKLTASIENNRLFLTDNTTGSTTFSVKDTDGSQATKGLGLTDIVSSGNTITSQKLTAGLNSVLLRNLNGGQGVGQQGTISITDRGGRTAQIDLSQASSLSDVLHAINNAETVDGDAVRVNASYDALGKGLLIEDTSGETSSNLVIVDESGSTLAAQLNIATDTSENSIKSDSLNHQYINEASSLVGLPAKGGNFSPGSVRIIDSKGKVAVINFTSAVKTVGDVITRINAATGIGVTAQLNKTGDGFELVDTAGGTGSLKVEELDGGTTARDLKILGETETGSSEKIISSRFAQVIDIKDTDTLSDIVTKINASGTTAKASLFQDGSQFNPTRINIISSVTGAQGRIIIDDGDLDLGFNTIVKGDDAVLKYGTNASNTFLLTSNTNVFKDVIAGVNVTLLQASTTSSEVSLTRDTTRATNALQNFITTFNSIVDTSKELTKFDSEANQRGLLQGDNFVLRLQARMENLINRRVSVLDSDISSLGELGINVTTGGKLQIDDQKLADILESSPDSIANFFLDEKKGFGKFVKDLSKSLTDSVDGTFKKEYDSYDSQIQGIQDQIDQTNELLDLKKTRFYNQFVAMDSLLGQLQSQQTALTAFANAQSKNKG